MHFRIWVEDEFGVEHEYVLGCDVSRENGEDCIDWHGDEATEAGIMAYARGSDSAWKSDSRAWERIAREELEDLARDVLGSRDPDRLVDDD